MHAVDLRYLLFLIRGLVSRLALLARYPKRHDILVLAPLLIRLQDGRASRHEVEAAIAPFQSVARDLLRNLARSREASMVPAGRRTHLPLGCRLGLLHFSPLLQILRILRGSGADALVDGWAFEEIPSTKEAILRYLELTCGWRDDLDAVLKRRFNHTLLDYARYLVRLRSKDPVLFVLLMAREFSLANLHAERECVLDQQWLWRAARLAEVQRVAEIMSYCGHRRQVTTGIIRKALLAIVYRKRPSQRRAALRTYRHCLPAIRRLTLSMEALRALLLGDFSTPPLVDPRNGVTPSWNRIAAEAKLVAASRAELFSWDRSRHGWTRRNMSIDMYYGIPLEQLAAVALIELSRHVAGNEGTEDCAVIAAAMCQHLLGLRLSQHRFAKQASLISQVYLRQAGKLGSAGRFDPRFQIYPFADAGLFAGASALAIGASTAASRTSVRALIDAAAALVMKVCPLQIGPTDYRVAAKVSALLATSLTLPTMDPIFASLLDRRMSELGIRPLDRSDNWDDLASRAGLMEKLRIVRPDVRAAFARFRDLGDRFNHPDVNAKRPAHPHRPLAVKGCLPALRSRRWTRPSIHR